MGFLADPVKSIEGTLSDPGKTISNGLNDVNRAVSSAGNSITQMLSNPKTLAMLAMNYFMPGSDTVLDGFDAAEVPTDLPTDPMGPPAPDGGLPPVNEGPMGPPEPMGPPTPEAPTSQLPSGLSKITSNVAKSFINDLLPKSTPTSALGTSNESALSSATPSGTSTPTCTFLCNQAELLSDKGSGYKGGLEKLQQMYARGGIAHLSGGAQPEVDAQKIWQQAFCEKNRGLCFGCDKPELMHYQNTQQGHGLSPLKHIYSSMTGGYAKGGLPEKYHAAAPKGHNPEFITGVTGYYACGGGTGQSDDIPAMLHDGDYVMDAETVSALGDGSSKAGKHVLDGFRTQVPHKAEGGSNPVPAKIADGEYVFPAAFVTSLGGGDNKRGAEILDGLRTKLRAHKRGAPLDKIPPKAKDPIDYIKKAKA